MSNQNMSNQSLIHPTVTCVNCERDVPFTATYQCVNGANMSYECVDDDGICKDILVHKQQKEKERKEEQQRIENELFKLKFGFERSDLQFVGSVLRDACTYYVNKERKLVMKHNGSEWIVVTDKRVIELVGKRFEIWNVLDEEYFE